MRRRRGRARGGGDEEEDDWIPNFRATTLIFPTGEDEMSEDEISVDDRMGLPIG